MVASRTLLFHTCLIDMRACRSLTTESCVRELAATDDSYAHRLVSGSRRAVQDIDEIALIVTALINWTCSEGT
ncbi:hypothetical protein EV702DRAFT_1079127, partial [Suillus placidus]